MSWCQMAEQSWAGDVRWVCGVHLGDCTGWTLLCSSEVEILARSGAWLQDCTEHWLRTDLLHRETPSPAAVGAAFCNPLPENSYGFPTAFHISFSTPPRRFWGPKCSRGTGGTRVAVTKQRWAAGEEGLTLQSLPCLWARGDISSLPALLQESAAAMKGTPQTPCIGTCACAATGDTARGEWGHPAALALSWPPWC